MHACMQPEGWSGLYYCAKPGRSLHIIVIVQSTVHAQGQVQTYMAAHYAAQLPPLDATFDDYAV